MGSQQNESKNIVIIGGGIIGSSTAYFLTRHPKYDRAKHKITILEASNVASGASGKAGGLLALWAYPSSIVPLSFKLHAELAKEHDGASRWGYRRCYSGSLEARGRVRASGESKVDGGSVSLHKRDGEDRTQQRPSGIPKDLDWFAPESMIAYESMGDPETTAQVHPYQFTTSMASLAQEAGAEVVIGRVTDISSKSGASEHTVQYISGETKEKRAISATDVVICAGPWTKRIWPSAPISGLRAHSVTIRPTRPVSAYAVFTEIKLPSKGKGQPAQHVSPEIYARPNNELYACGTGDTNVPLPETTADVEVDQSRCDELIEHVSSISDEIRDGQVLVRQACYLPNVDRTGRFSGPMIGKTRTPGIFMAAGHTCWGIQNGPGTGKLMSEFVFDGEAKSAKIKDLDPLHVL